LQRTDFRCRQCVFTLIPRDGYFDAGQPADLNFSSVRRDLLASIESSHFWFQPRNELMRNILKRLIPHQCRIIELGCGTGRFLPELQTLASSLVAVDAFEVSIQAAAERRTTAVLVRGDINAVPVDDGTFDAAVSMDVLEHVEPIPFLQEARRIVRDNGWLVLSVPASPGLWSRVDEAAGHRCRYTSAKLLKELNETGWKLYGSSHYQCLLYPLMVISRIFIKGNSGIEQHPPRILNTFLGAINAFEVKAFSHTRLPWGSTLIAWAKKI